MSVDKYSDIHKYKCRVAVNHMFPHICFHLLLLYEAFNLEWQRTHTQTTIGLLAKLTGTNVSRLLDNIRPSFSLLVKDGR